MRRLLPLILFSALVAAARAATTVEIEDVKPGYESFCYDKEDDVLYSPGELMRWKSTECGEKFCSGPNGKGQTVARINTCGVAGDISGCRVEYDMKVPYPKCCGTIVCPKEGGGETRQYVIE